MKPLTLLAVAALLTGCAGPTPPEDDTIRIVASTDVYGDLAQTVGGQFVSVTSLIAGARDPHSFEASARDRLSVSKADVVVENGGGYDPFVETLVEASGSSALVMDVAELVALPDGGNEHLWYDFGAMDTFAKELATTLRELDPAHSATFDANYATLSADLAELSARVNGMVSGAVAVTETVPLQLLEAAGLTNVTPDAFTEAIEEGGDVPPAALKATLALFTQGGVVLLAYNDQTASPETERVRSAAAEAGIPVVNFTETLPDGSDYVSWMSSNIGALRAAL